MSELITLNDPNGAVADIIFVHGLGGDAESTWTAKNSGLSWPQMLVQDIPGVSIHSLAYDAALLNWLGGAMPLSDRANEVLDELESCNIGKRPIVFICHSLGGLVVKQLLRAADPLPAQHHWKRIYDAVEKIVFLATPHAGSDTANYLSGLGKVLPKGSSIAVKELEKNNQLLRDLNNWFRNSVDKINVEIKVYYETKDVSGLRIVDANSADPGIAGVTPVPVDVNHMEIAKPKSKKDVVYRRILNYVGYSSTTAGNSASVEGPVSDSNPDDSPVDNIAIEQLNTQLVDELESAMTRLVKARKAVGISDGLLSINCSLRELAEKSPSDSLGQLRRLTEYVGDSDIVDKQKIVSLSCILELSGWVVIAAVDPAWVVEKLTGSNADAVVSVEFTAEDEFEADVLSGRLLLRPVCFLLPDEKINRGFQTSDPWTVKITSSDVEEGASDTDRVESLVSLVYKQLLKRDLKPPVRQAHYDEINVFVRELEDEKINLQLSMSKAELTAGGRRCFNTVIKRLEDLPTLIISYSDSHSGVILREGEVKGKLAALFHVVGKKLGQLDE